MQIQHTVESLSYYILLSHYLFASLVEAILPKALVSRTYRCDHVLSSVFEDNCLVRINELSNTISSQNCIVSWM
jgi:hypothetical protein